MSVHQPIQSFMKAKTSVPLTEIVRRTSLLPKLQTGKTCSVSRLCNFYRVPLRLVSTTPMATATNTSVFLNRSVEVFLDDLQITEKSVNKLHKVGFRTVDRLVRIGKRPNFRKIWSFFSYWATEPGRNCSSPRNNAPAWIGVAATPFPANQTQAKCWTRAGRASLAELSGTVQRSVDMNDVGVDRPVSSRALTDVARAQCLAVRLQSFLNQPENCPELTNVIS